MGVENIYDLSKKWTINIGKHAFLYFLILRLASVWIVQTWYVPDEYWQSLEVGHHLAFGYGYLTWEWKMGLRSYIHPLLIGMLYKILEILHIDSVSALVLLPRVMQAVLTAYSDYSFYQWCGRKKWAAFCIATEWFWFYTGSRTLVNTVEACLTTIALSRFPWKGSKIEAEDRTDFIWIVALVCAIRPTAAIPWVPLCLYHLVIHRENLKWLLLARYIPIGIFVLLLSSLIDSLCYGTFIVTPWEFFKANVYNDIGTHYGSMPWYWYVTYGMPTVLGVHSLAFVWASLKLTESYQGKPIPLVLLGTIAFTVFIYSCLSHKEFRFMSPLISMAMYISSDYLAKWSGKASRGLIWLIAATLLAGSAGPAVYLSMTHQRGALDVMPILGKLAEERPKETSFLFLMPCHSTPLYSHIHVNVSTRFLTCEPDFTGKTDYKDEADRFYTSPVDWFLEEYPENSTLPTHIIAFDHLHIASSVFSRYKQLHTIFYTGIPTGRVGSNIIVHQINNY